MHLLHSILPNEGFIAVAVQRPGHKAPHHYWCNGVDQALQTAAVLDQSDTDQVFVAQAAYKTSDNRTQSNVLSVKSFWTDIDCGEKKPYATQGLGAQALKAFCEAAKLPFPSLVSSGNGLYAHWVLTEAIAPAVWATTAGLLKKVMAAYEFACDGACTADSSRILRPVGATHRKDRDNPKTVRLLMQAAEVDFTEFSDLVKAAAAGKHIAVKAPAKVSVLNSAFAIPNDAPPSSALTLSGKCAQIERVKTTKGDVDEPSWYAAIGLLRYTTEASQIIHQWSTGHSGYEFEQTEAKIMQHQNAHIGPTTCAYFSSLNPSICKGCKHAGRVTTPLQLGYTAPEVIKQEELPKEEDKFPEPPEGFRLTKSGIWTTGGDQICVYHRPVYISSVNKDYFGESVTVKAWHPYDGWYEFSFASSKTCDAKTFNMVMTENSVQPIGKEASEGFMHYFKMYMQKVRDAAKLTKLASSMGWQGEDDALSFAHGAETYNPGGTTTRNGYSSAAPDFVRAMALKGNTEQWVENTKILNKPGLEGLAFEFLCAAFGSPLVRFTGYDGAMVAVVGNSGVGKTITGLWGLSAWGDPNRLSLMRDDTKNALMGRLGVYGSLPAYMDEITNIESKELSDLVYRVTQGREKVRLSKDSRERKNINHWNLLAVVSSNQSLVDKLSTLKGDAAAEINRVFEYEVYAGFDKLDAELIINTATENYGEVGKLYAQYLCEHQGKHKANLQAISKNLDKHTQADSSERFWTMLAAVAIYGGLIARQIGLSHVDVEKLIPWISNTIVSMRQQKVSNEFDAVSWLGSFLDRFAGSMLVVPRYDATEKFHAQSYREPRGTIIGRIEEDVMRLWVSADVIKRELTKEHISTKKMAELLESLPYGPALTNRRTRITLGRGTAYSGVPQYCWELNMKHPLLGARVISSVKDVQSAVLKEAKG